MGIDARLCAEDDAGRAANFLICCGARCVGVGVGVDVLRGDVQRVLFADIPRNYVFAPTCTWPRTAP